jgi:hypothetical protein
MDKTKLTRYRTRMEKLYWVGNIFVWLVPIAIFYFGSSLIAWLVYVSTITVFLALAFGFEAVFDSLSERVNIQSAWIDVRLSVIERAVNATSGQEAWRKEGIPTNDNHHYFRNYPERLDG